MAREGFEWEDHHDARVSRTLVMEYTVHCKYRRMILAGMGGVSRAVEDCVRAIIGVANVDPESITYRVEES